MWQWGACTMRELVHACTCMASAKLCDGHHRTRWALTHAALGDLYIEVLVCCA